MNDFTFLTLGQCFDNEQIDILNKRGTKAAVTDFSILLGAGVEDECHIDNDSSLEGRTWWYWLKSSVFNDHESGYIVDVEGDGFYEFITGRAGGVRPALLFTEIDRVPTNGKSPQRAKDGILEVEYGYYPQKAVSKYMQEKLEREYKSGTILKTGNTYTTDSRKYDAYDEGFLAKQHEEYEYDEKRYVRVEDNSGAEFTLSNGENTRAGNNVWVEVLPIKWWIDEKAKIMITEKLIFSGVQYKYESEYHIKIFDKTDIKIFMDTYWSKDIEQIREENHISE